MAKLDVEAFNEFLYKEYPAVRYAMYPWLPVRGLAMIAGYRGIGKTYLSLCVAYAIATGGSVLGWQANAPMSVLYVDGEMDPAELQMRLRQIDTAARQDGNGNPGLARQNLRILTHADQEMGIPDLADPSGDGRWALEQALGDTQCLFIDNLSSTCHTGVENDSESWVVMQNWLLKLRRNGKTVVMVHHTGKPNEFGEVRQRGTSKREDVLNTSILLHTGKGGGFKLEFSKVRGFLADKPFKVQIVIDEDAGTLRLVREGVDDEIMELHSQGLSVRQIGSRLGIGKSTVQRKLAKLADDPLGTAFVPARDSASQGVGVSRLLDDEC